MLPLNSQHLKPVDGAILASGITNQRYQRSEAVTYGLVTRVATCKQTSIDEATSE